MSLFSDIVGAIGTTANIGTSIYDRVNAKNERNENMEREDNAVQRKVADMYEAGLSPLNDFTGASSNAGAPVSNTFGTIADMNGINGMFSNKLTEIQQSKDAELKGAQLEGIQYENEMKRLDAMDYAQKKLDEAQSRLQELENKKKQGEATEEEIKYAKEQVKMVKAQTYSIYNSEKRADTQAEVQNAKTQMETKDIETSWTQKAIEQKTALLKTVIESYPEVKLNASLGGKLMGAGAEIISKGGSLEELISKVNECYKQFSGENKDIMSASDFSHSSGKIPSTNAVKPKKSTHYVTPQGKRKN